MVRWVVGSILHGVDPLSYFSFQPVLHDWCYKGRGMYYPVCGMVHIKEPLLLIGKSSKHLNSPQYSPCGQLSRQDKILFTLGHRRNTYINILLYTRDKMVDSKYINYNVNTYTNTCISI